MESSRADLEQERGRGKGLRLELESHKQTSESQTKRIQSLERDLASLRSSEEESRSVLGQLKQVLENFRNKKKS